MNINFLFTLVIFTHKILNFKSSAGLYKEFLAFMMRAVITTQNIENTGLFHEMTSKFQGNIELSIWRDLRAKAENIQL